MTTKKIYLLFNFLCPFFILAQMQLGNAIEGEVADDFSGWSVSLSSDGSVLAIGAPGNDGNGPSSGHVRVYENQNGIWVQIGQDIDGEDSDSDGFSSFGASVSLSSDGSTVAVGGPTNDATGFSAGHVRVYGNQNNTWVQIGQDIDAEASFDRFGSSVSLSSDGSVLAIGAPRNDGNGIDSGHVRIFKNQSGNWVQIGNDIDGESAPNLLGTSVSLSSDGSIVAIGAPWNGANSGHVRVYENQNSNWVQIGQDIEGEAIGDLSGSSVSLSSDGTIVAIGAPGNDGSGSFSGHVRVYENQSGTWVQIGNDIDGEGLDDAIEGMSVSLSSDGSLVAIGAPRNNGRWPNSGHVRVFQNQSGSWVQIGNDINGEFTGDRSGASVSLSSNGSVVAIGSPYNNGNGLDSGHVRVFDLSAILSSDEFVLNNFSLYPNPARDQFSISLYGMMQLEQITIYNSLGQFLFTSKETTIDSSSLSTGLYFVEIQTDQGKATKKLIIE